MIKKLLFLALFIIPAFSQAQYISSDNESNKILTAYTDGSANDSVFVFCAPVVPTIKATATGGVAPYTYKWYLYQNSTHQFNTVPFQTNSLVLTSTLSNPASGGYKVSISDAIGNVIGCDIAWVWNLNYPVNAGPDVAGCNTLTLNGSVSGTPRFRYYNPPADAFIVDNTTTVTVCFTATHTFVSDLAYYLVGPASCGSPVVLLSPNPGAVGQGATCNGGNNVNNLCFTTVPSAVYNVCTAATPVTGTYSAYSSATSNTSIDWSPIVGCNAGAGGWKVQIFDCINQDVGSLTNANVTFSGNSVCGPSTINYNSGAINSAINDNSCTAGTASVFNVPQPSIDTTALFINDVRTTTWTANPPQSITNPNNVVTTVNPFPTEDVDFILTSTSSFGCVKTDTMHYTYINMVRAIIDTVMPICANASPITLTAFPVAGTWSGTGITNTATGVFNPALVGNDTATVIFIPTNICFLNDTMQIIINPLPIITVSNTGPYCPNDSIFIAASGGVSYSWTGPLSFTSNTDIDTVLNATPGGPSANNGAYNVVVTDVNGCQNTDSTNVVVNNNPVVIPSNNGPLCEGDTAQFSVNSAVTYSWTGPNGFSSTNQNFTLDSVVVSIHSGVYSVTILDTNGCVNSNNTTLVINPLVYPVFTAVSPLCQNEDTIALNATPVGGVWSGLGVTDPNIGIFDPAVAGAGNIYVTYTPPSSTTCGRPDSMMIVVKALPFISATNSGPYCPGDSIFIDAAGTGIFSWTGPNSYASSDQNDTILNAAQINSGLYTVTLTGVNGCIDTAVTNVVVNQNPTPGPSVASPACFGDTVVFNAANGMSSYVWSGPNAFSFTTQSPQINGVVIANSGHYAVMVTDVNGCSAVDSVDLVITNTGQVNITAVNPICVDAASFTLSVDVTGGYWIGNGITDSITGAYLPSQAGSGIDTIFYIPSGFCLLSDTIMIQVNALPVVVTSNTGPYCAGDTIFIGATGGTIYSWTGPLSFTSSTDVDTIIGAVPSGVTANAGMYYVSVTDANGCQINDSTNVVINNNPVVSPSNNGPICEGATANFGVNSAVSYNWSGPNGFTSTIQNPSITNTVSTTHTGTYNITIVDTNNCVNTSTTNLVVNSLPIVIASNAYVYCAGTTITLNSTPAGATTYAWTGPNAYNASTQNPAIANATTAMSGVYTVTVTANGCTASDTTNVTVNPLPSISDNSFSQCENLALNLSSNGGGTYSWTGPLGFTSNIASPQVSPSATTAMSGNYIVTVTSPAGCVKSATTTISINAGPAITAGSNSPVCENSPLTLSASASGATSFAWVGPLSYSSTQASPTVSANATVSMSGTYSVAVSGANGCQSSSSITVVVNAIPVPVASSSASSYCAGTNAVLNVSPATGTITWTGPNSFSSTSANPVISSVTVNDAGNYVVNVNNGGCIGSSSVAFAVNPSPAANAGADQTICEEDSAVIDAGAGSGLTYLWSNNATTQSITVTGAGTYSVIVTLNGVCSATDEMVVTIEDCEIFEVKIPNIFTPNGDGKNDVFEIYATGVSNVDYLIYDRWGKKEYEGNTPWKGVGASDGVFYYIITVTEKKTGTVHQPYQGTITLVK